MLPRSLRNAKLLIFITLLALIALGYWASHGTLDSVARAPAQLNTAVPTQIIQASSDGVISQLMVQKGEAVAKGQLLVQLEDGQARAGLDDSLGKVAALRASLARLQAEVFERKLSFPESVQPYPMLVANQTELYNRRKRALDSEVNILGQSASLIKRELVKMEALLQTGDIGEAEVLRLQRQMVEVTGQISLRKSKFFQDAQTEMTKVNEELSTQEQVLNDRQVAFDRMRIYAPADGVISKIDIETTGARVRPGDVVMSLLPTGSRLIVAAKMPPAEMAKIRAGLPAMVKLDAYDYTIYGTYPGKVTYISADALNEKTLRGDSYYYKVDIELDEQAVAKHNLQFPDTR
ncbi:MAG: HlyD family efflux transporter periplasmic adaptor subunit [Methylobacillus glycogenes]|nr:HlyD family efflux transporter periplasmic adaptor subunit [Methylobacillus glycogenes]